MFSKISVDVHEVPCVLNLKTIRTTNEGCSCVIILILIKIIIITDDDDDYC